MKDYFYDLVGSRRSIRRFKPEPVPEEVLIRILDAGRRAPSAHNRQPWRFVVLRSSGELDRLARSMGEVLKHDLESDGVETTEIEKDVARSYRRITGAAVGVVMCLDENSLDEYPDPERRQAERTMGIQSLAMAGANILLAAHAEGLGACWICAPLFVPDLVRIELELAGTWIPQGMILLGYPADEGRERVRKPLQEVTVWR